MDSSHLTDFIPSNYCSIISLSLVFCLGLFVRPYLNNVPPWSSGSKTESTKDKKKITPKFGEECKMVFVVRQDLKMGKGKAAAQCCHAAIHLYQKAKQEQPKILSYWERNACPKVVVKGQDEDELNDVMRKARSAGLVNCVIHDAGRTQIAPNSKTVLGIGPGPVSLIDQVTGHLKLY